MSDFEYPPKILKMSLREVAQLTIDQEKRIKELEQQILDKELSTKETKSSAQEHIEAYDEMKKFHLDVLEMSKDSNPYYKEQKAELEKNL